MAERSDFALWLRRQGIQGITQTGGLVAVRRSAEADRESNFALLAELDRLHADYCAEYRLPRLVGVGLRPMDADHLAALAGVLFADSTA